MDRGFSQDKLARHLNLTFQQIQKYEQAANRIGASRLLQIAQTLNTPVEWFFEGFVCEEKQIERKTQTNCPIPPDIFELIGVVNALPPKLRKSFRELSAALADLSRD